MAGPIARDRFIDNEPSATAWGSIFPGASSAVLALNAGNFISYRAIYNALRGPGFVSARGVEVDRANVRTALKRVRSKFRALAPDFDAIETYVAFGYRWHTGGDHSLGPHYGKPAASNENA